jgi:hypothetical protein
MREPSRSVAPMDRRKGQGKTAPNRGSKRQSQHDRAEVLPFSTRFDDRRRHDADAMLFATSRTPQAAPDTAPMTDLDVRLSNLLDSRNAVRDDKDRFLEIAEIVAGGAAAEFGRQLDEIGILSAMAAYLRDGRPARF